MTQPAEERRQSVLTHHDLEAIKEAIKCSKCAFSHEESDTLKSIARNMNRASSLATRTIVTGMVLGFLSLVWFALKHLAMEVLKGGVTIK